MDPASRRTTRRAGGRRQRRTAGQPSIDRRAQRPERPGGDPPRSHRGGEWLGWGRRIDRQGREVGFVGHDPPFRPDRVEHDRGRDREREHEHDVPVGDRREERREQDHGRDHTPGRSERRCAFLPPRPMRDMAARRDRRADEVVVMQRGSRRELPNRLVARGAPREVGKKRFFALPACSRRGHGHPISRPERVADEGSWNLA